MLIMMIKIITMINKFNSVFTKVDDVIQDDDDRRL